MASERFYGLASYRFRKWFQTGVYYSALYPNVDRRAGRENMQHDFAATLRFDINAQWLWKVEGHYMHGTAALSSTLNNDKPMSQLKQDWAVLLVKTTAYF
jgi:hypothetical protein